MVRGVFLKTFFISLGIFVIGFFIGSVVENSLTADLRERTESIQNSIQEIELESLYLLSVSNSSCPFLNDLVRKTNNNLDDLAGKLSSYDEEKIVFTSNDLVNIKSKYTVLLVKDWLLQNSVRQHCKTNSASILYFYDRDCTDCLFQGDILTVLKQQFKEKVMIFPLDHSLGTSPVSLLESYYNITRFPSVVIDEAAYSGIIPFKNLREYVCSTVSDEKCRDDERT